MEIEMKMGDRIVKAGFQLCGLVSNCGAQILHSFWAWSWWPAGMSPPFGRSPKPPTIEEVFQLLDTKKNAWLDIICNSGFMILSDRINDTPTSDQFKEAAFSVRTATLVQYLIDRKIGMVVRMPVVANMNYSGTSAITSWMWIKRPEAMIDPSVAIHSNDKFDNATKLDSNYAKKYKELGKVVDLFVKDEIKINEHGAFYDAAA